MNNFKLGGLRHRKDDLGGRPKSDADYSTKKRFDRKPRHDVRSGERNEYRSSKEVQLFTTKCTTCGKSCEVPFRPDGTKPVLCRDCFASKNASPANSNNLIPKERYSTGAREERRPEYSYDSKRPQPASSSSNIDYTTLVRQLNVLETKVNLILDLVKASAIKPVLQSDDRTEQSKVDDDEVIIKVRKPKKELVKKVAKKVTKKVTKKSTK